MAKSNKKLSDGLTQTLPDRPLCYFTLSKTILLVKGPVKTVPFVSLLCLTLYDFMHQGRSSGWERVNAG